MNVRPPFARALRLVLASGVAFVPIAAAAQSVQPGNLVPPPQVPRVDANGVDVSSGTPVYEKIELSIGGQGLGALPYIRYFSGNQRRTNFDSEYARTWSLLTAWTSTFTFGNSSENFESVQPAEPTGSTFTPNPSDPYGSTGEYRTKDGTVVAFTHLQYVFQSGGSGSSSSIADSVQYRNGVRWTYYYEDIPYSTTHATRVKSIITNTGYQLKFYYQSNVDPVYPASLLAWGTAVKVTAINNAYEYCDPLADNCALTINWPSVQYTFPAGYSFAAVDPTGGETRYLAVSSLTVREPGSPTDNLIYTSQNLPICGDQGPDYRVASANINGRITNYSYACGVNWTVTATGPAGDVNVYTAVREGNAGGSVTQHQDPLNRIYKYEYQPGNTPNAPLSGNLTKATLPETNYSQYTRDSDGNVTQTRRVAKPGSGLADIVESQVIGPFAQPSSVTDARGNVTTYTYDPTHGGVRTETDPAVNGVAPVKRYDYAQRYAWIKNSVGNYVPAALPVWVRTEERSCTTTNTVGNACQGGSADEVVTTYDYGPNSGPNNLQLRGAVVTADGVSLRTCYSYDVYGNKISETTPRAGLLSCP